MIHRYKVDYPLALEYLYMAMQVFQQNQDLQAMSSIHSSLGVVLEKMGQYEQALQSHQQSLELNRELNDESGIASDLYNLGDIRREMGDNEAALTYFNDALALDLASGDVKNIAYSYHKLGYTKMQLGDLATAQEDIAKALGRVDLFCTNFGLNGSVLIANQLCRPSGLSQRAVAKSKMLP